MSDEQMPYIVNPSNAGGIFYLKFDPNVTATALNPIVTYPEVSGPGILYPASHYPHVEITPPTFQCAGPGCEHTTHGLPMEAGWITVADGRINHFCSLMCLANWLAGELAKEESR